MLYLLHGKNFKESRKKLHSLVEALLKKEPNASHFRLDGDNFTEDSLEEMISSQTLFAGKYIVVMDKLLKDEITKEIILGKLKDISASENIFIFIEEELNNTILARFKKRAEKIQEFTEKETKKDDKFNIFSITDAFGLRDRKRVWVLYQKALNQGIVAEEVHGILVWQMKNLLMVKDEKNLNDLGLNPFVLRKSIGFASKYTKEELIKLSDELIKISHESRRGMGEFGIFLERFILSF